MSKRRSRHRRVMHSQRCGSQLGDSEHFLEQQRHARGRLNELETQVQLASQRLQHISQVAAHSIRHDVRLTIDVRHGVALRDTRELRHV
ncbi:MAG: hypothetical protein ACO32I_06645 [Candidatus Limnocylindrus sp.]